MGRFVFDPETGLMMPKRVIERVGKRLCSWSSSAALPGMITADPYWDLVSLLLPGYDLKDHSKYRRAITVNGTVAPAATHTLFGFNTLDFSAGSLSNFLSMTHGPLDMTGQDYTIECWYLGTATAATGAVISNFVTGSRSVELLMANTGVIPEHRVSKDGTTVNVDIGAGSIGTGVFGFAAACRQGTAFNIWTNTTRGSTPGTMTGVVEASTTSVLIGKNPDNTFPLKGYLGQLRVTIGVARYTTSTIAVPIGPFPQG